MHEHTALTHTLTHTTPLSLPLLNSPFTPLPVLHPLGFPSPSNNRLHSGLGSAMRHSVRAAVKLICVYYLGLSHTYTHSWLVLLKVVAPFPLKKTHASLPHYQKKRRKNSNNETNSFINQNFV